MDNQYQSQTQNPNQNLNQEVNQEFEHIEQSNPNDSYTGNEGKKEKRKSSKLDKKLKRFGLVLLILGFLGMGFFSSRQTHQVLNQRVLTGVSAGTVFLSSDQQLSAQDYTITHSEPYGECKIWIWDYAAEDGDYVKVFVDGVAITDEFMITNHPVELSVPSKCVIQILGVKDGGGGITYAVRYGVNNTTYFNGMGVGEGNLYTLIQAIP